MYTLPINIIYKLQVCPSYNLYGLRLKQVLQYQGTEKMVQPLFIYNSYTVNHFILCHSFIIDRVRRHGNDELTVNHADLGGTELHDPTLKQVAQCLRQIGDELDNNEELQR